MSLLQHYSNATLLKVATVALDEADRASQQSLDEFHAQQISDSDLIRTLLMQRKLYQQRELKREYLLTKQQQT